MLTKRQRLVLLFIAAFTRKHGWAPSLREIGKALEIASPNGVLFHLTSLERKGFIVRGKGGARQIRIVRDAA